MNDAQLSERLRALRVAPPATGFEQRLREGLRREALALGPGAPVVGARARAARRWTGRAGLSLVIALGASAAAAAVGLVSWAPRQAEHAGARVAPAAPAEAHRARATRERSQSAGVNEASSAEIPSAPAPEAASPAPGAEPPSALGAPGTEAPKTPASLSSQSSSGRAKRAEIMGGDRSRPEAPERMPRRQSSLEHPNADTPVLVPFELPGVDLSRAPAPPLVGTARERSSARRGPRDGARGARRALPKLERSAHDRGERGRSDLMRERGRTRENRGRENGERGLERAREARERNGR